MRRSHSWHRTSLLSTPQYVACPGYRKYARWLELAGNGGGKVFVESKSASGSEEAVSIIIGRVSANRLYVSPKGSWSDKFGTEFAKSKFQFTLVAPKETDYYDDFKVALDVLLAAQRDAGVTKDHKNLFTPDGSSTGIRFSANVFQELVSIMMSLICYM